MKQWLQFQTTTYGPILQHVFRWTFTESLPAARAGYVKNFRRVLQVLNDELARLPCLRATLIEVERI